MVGKYINALPYDALQRLAGAQQWCVHGYVDRKGARCILGHAEDWHWDAESQSLRCGAPDLLRLREEAGDTWLNWPPLIGRRFDHLVERYGLDQVVLLIRNRVAGRERHFTVPAPVYEVRRRRAVS